MKQISSVPFQGTAEQEQELRQWLNENKTQPGAALAALQKGQEIYGYLPLEVQKIIAEALDMPLAELYGISTFYSQFSLTPKGKHKISVCLGTACYVKGSGQIFSTLEDKLCVKAGETTPDGLFSLEACRCVGACGLSPVMTVDDNVYSRMSTDSDGLEAILNKYRPAE